MYRQPRSRQPVYPGTIPAVQLPVQYPTELDTPAMVPQPRQEQTPRRSHRPSRRPWRFQRVAVSNEHGRGYPHPPGSDAPSHHYVTSSHDTKPQTCPSAQDMMPDPRNRTCVGVGLNLSSRQRNRIAVRVLRKWP
jgi:hypothetical protein